MVLDEPTLSTKVASTQMFSNLPNTLTMLRIFLVPIICSLIAFDSFWPRWIALALFVVASITDYFDGKIAREEGLITPFGKVMDPIADKLLVVSIIVVLLAVDSIAGPAVVAALIILLREILIAGLREFLAGSKVTMPVANLAKWKTGVQMVALGFLIVDQYAPWWSLWLPNHSIHYVGDILLWIAAVLTAWTGYGYLKRGLDHIQKLSA
jgi:cardiolipin synthase